MCTLAIMMNAFPGYPLVVAANRDEQFSRPSRAPMLKERPHRILSPTDLQRGGTWIGVNDRPLLVGLTNRRSIASVRGLRSRGALVADALKASTVDGALASVIDRAPGEHNAFHMVITDGKRGVIVTGNGVGDPDAAGPDAKPGFRHAPLQDGLTIVTNLGLGPDSPRGAAIVDAWTRLRSRGTPPRATSLVPMLTWHAHERLLADPDSRQVASACLHPTEDDPDYGTVSSAVIRLSDGATGAPKAWHYWHGDRKKSSVFCGIRWSDVLTLPIHGT